MQMLAPFGSHNQKKKNPDSGTGPLYNKIGPVASGERFLRKPWANEHYRKKNRRVVRSIQG